MSVFFRVDNVNFSDCPPEKLAAVVDLVEERGGVATLGVTPGWHGKENTQDAAAVKKMLGRHALALHGVTHECRKLPAGEHEIMLAPSHEFNCVDYGEITAEEQRGWLREGKEGLKELLGAGTSIFVPPQHAVNSNTITALKAEGFKAVSLAGKWRAKPYVTGGLAVLPTFGLDILREVRAERDRESFLRHFKHYFDELHARGYYGFFVHPENASEASLPALAEFLDYVCARDEIRAPDEILAEYELI